MAIDLVCGMEVNDYASGYSVIYAGERYLFCSEGCLAEFNRHPQEYMSPPVSCCPGRSEEDGSSV
jgi:YHS domain-containing protein